VRLPAALRLRRSSQGLKRADLRHAFQGLIHSLVFPDTAGSKTILITSSEPREGVSYVTTSLAVEIAEQFQESVLVAEAGALLTANPERMEPLCVLSRFEDVWTLAATREQPTPNGVEAAVKSCLERLQQRFAYILIDCPSLATSSDSQVLAPTVDGVILIAAAGRTSRQDIRRGAARLQAAGGVLWGCILNCCRHPSFDVLPQKDIRSVSRGSAATFDNGSSQEQSHESWERIRVQQAKGVGVGNTSESGGNGAAGAASQESPEEPVRFCLRALSDVTQA
jgi:Mrp family chromosome partitioning ATPase